jgi:hypothetical protein
MTQQKQKARLNFAITPSGIQSSHFSTNLGGRQWTRNSQLKAMRHPGDRKRRNPACLTTISA